MAKGVKLIEITDARFDNLACGSCGSVILGYDEEICPSCAAFINVDDVRKMTEKEFKEAGLCVK